MITCALLSLSLTAVTAADYADGILKTPAYTLRLDPATGRLVSLRAADSDLDLVTGDESGWWELAYRDGSRVGPADWPGSVVWDGTALHITHRGDGGALELALTPHDEQLDIVATVEPTHGEVLTLRLPRRLNFAVERINEVHYPAELGIALQRPWFEPASDGSAGFERVPCGPEGLRRVCELSCDTSATDGATPVPVIVTDAGEDWLQEETQRLARARRVRVDRPGREPPDVSLIADADGHAWAAGWRRGAGWLWRLCGGDGDQPGLATRTVADVLAHFLAEPGRPRGGKLGVLALSHGPRTGGWAQAPVAKWLELIRLNADLRDADLVVIDSADALEKVLRDRSCFALVNPYGEWFPARDRAHGEELLGLVQAYVEAGGIWWETGGYPFYYFLVPRRYRSLAGSHPSLWADFWHLDSTAGKLTCYGLQPDAEIFVPAQLETGADAAGAYFSRGWQTFVRAGERWTAPTVRFVVGRSMPEAARAYVAANGMTRTLAEKMRPEILERFRQSILLKYQGRCEDQIRALPRLPGPCVLHHSNYLKGGFDKQYPDHLPVNPSFGSPEEFATLLRLAKEAGHLMMPYTNPTWWCDKPRGPTFVKYGEAPLLIGLDGRKQMERYSSNVGWTTTLWHPAVAAANAEILRQFTEDYPVDILFQDQVGARRFRYDLNPASPTPHAYTQGLLELARHDSAVVPLGTENGYDRLINYESLFCGLTWSIVPTEGGPSWRRLWREQYPASTYRVSPLALRMAHDKCAFAHHDLGQFVTTPEVLAWTLALGYQLSYRISPEALDLPAKRHWLAWLSRLQRSIVSRLMTEPLDEWTYLTGDVIRARYGPVTIVANVGPQPYALNARTTLAGYGFLATVQGDPTAGLLTRWEGVEQPAAVGFVREGDELWLMAPPGLEVRVPGAEAVGGPGATGSRVVIPGGERQALPVPVALAARPRLEWQPRPSEIAIIAIPGMTAAWTRGTPDAFEAALGETAAVRGHGLKLVRLASLQAVREALRRPRETLAIINPYGEHFPSEGSGRWSEMLDAIGDFVRRGGIWLETGGASFFGAQYRRADGTMAREAVGSSGAARLGIDVAMLPVDEPPTRLHVTAAGRACLGDAVELLERTLTQVNRPSVRGTASVELVGSVDGVWLAGHQLGGYGWLFRFGGGHPDVLAMTTATAALIDHVLTMPAVRLPVKSGIPHLTHYRVR